MFVLDNTLNEMLWCYYLKIKEIGRVISMQTTSVLLWKITDADTSNPSTNHFYITNLQGSMTDLEHW